MIVRELISLVGFKVDKRAMARASKAARQLGSKMQKIGRTMSMALTAPIVGFGISILKIAGDFEASMNRVQVLTSATGEEFKKLRQQARDLGATTAFSAKEAADGMGFLAQSGFEVNEILAAMPSVLNLAGAAGQDLATTADQLSNIMKAFGLESSEAGHASDVLALAASSTNTNVSQMAEALKFAAPDAKALGVSLEQTAAMLGLVGDAGIQASMAGTGLRMALKRLLDPGEKAIAVFEKLNVATHEMGKDGKEKLRNIVDILQDLQDAKASPLDLSRIFGIRASTSMTILMDQGIDKLKELAITLKDFADDIALKQQEARMKGLKGEILALTSAYGELAIAIGDAGLLDDTTKFVKKLTNFTRELAKTNPEVLKLVTNIALFAAGVPIAIWALGSLTSAIGVMMAHPGVLAFAALVTGLVGLGVLAHTLANPTLGQAAGIEPSNVSTSKIPGSDALKVLMGRSLIPGTFLHQASNPSITVNNETTVNLNGGGTSLMAGEVVEGVARAVEAAMDSSLSKLQNDFAGAK